MSRVGQAVSSEAWHLAISSESGTAFMTLVSMVGEAPPPRVPLTESQLAGQSGVLGETAWLCITPHSVPSCNTGRRLGSLCDLCPLEAGVL